MVGTIAAGQFDNDRTGDETSAGGASFEPTVEEQIIFLQLRPGLQLLPKCITFLKVTAGKHPQAKFRIAGYGEEDNQFLLTLAISLGARNEVAKFNPQAVAAYHFANAVFADMFDFLPQYTTQPSAAEQTRAALLPDFLDIAEGDEGDQPIAVGQ